MLDELLADLTAEGDALRAAVTGADWSTPTSAQGWDIATTIAHLAWTDEASMLACRAASGDQGPWDALVLEAIEDPAGFVDTSAFEVAKDPELPARWDRARAGVVAALRVAEGKLPWFGPPMSPASMATARFMETWAHALDVYDGLGVVAERTDRVRHVCHLGVRTRNFAYSVHSLTPPASEFRVSLTLPSGAPFVAGPADAEQSVTGDAWEFAQLVTQRIHRADTSLVAVGDDASQWLDIAQAFAGLPGAGRPAHG